jgi:hypothetical protein
LLPFQSASASAATEWPVLYLFGSRWRISMALSSPKAASGGGLFNRTGHVLPGEADRTGRR